MFIRTKKIKGQTYAYLVENTWKHAGSRQEVTGYLGKCITPLRQTTTQPALSPEKTYKELIHELLKTTLLNHGFRISSSSHFVLLTQNSKENSTLDLQKQTVFHNNKPAILALNQGHLCEYTLTNLLRFSPSDNPEETAHNLAQALLAAGIHISTENLVILFEKFH